MIPINIPINIPGCQITGTLYDQYLPEDLDQDILQVRLPNGLTIDVGWYPEGDPNGAFKVVVYQRYWRNQLCDPVVTKKPSEAAKAVERLATKYYKRPSTPIIHNNWKIVWTQSPISYGPSSRVETEELQLAAG
jgi:hypothetical protein